MNNQSLSKDRRGYLNKKELKSRGWTDAMVRDLLGDPDDIRQIWVPGVGACETLLYSAPRVIKTERTEEFAQRQSRTQSRRAIASLGVAQKRAELFAWVDSIEIGVPKMEHDELLAAAWQHAQRRGAFCTSGDEERLMVNYLRHQQTNYDRLLDTTYRRIGTAEAKAAIRKKVFEAIADVYPELRGECMRQLRDRELFVNLCLV